LNQGGAVVKRHHLALPEKFENWTRLQTAKDVPDQGACGSCWAVASITVLKAHSEIGGNPRTFSAQEMLNCVQNPMECGGTGGCEGATAELAFDYVSKFGIATEKENPYLARDSTCRKSNAVAPSNIFAQGVDSQSLKQQLAELVTPGVHEVQLTSLASSVGMKAWERLPENEYLPLVRALVEHGPVAISVSAGAWSTYGRGIFDGCSKDAVIDHAVTLLGYSKQGSKKYWIVQNSWGRSWGMNGHIHLLREESDSHHCGTDRQPEMGTGCKGGPSSVKVCGMCGILYDNVVPHFSRS